MKDFVEEGITVDPDIIAYILSFRKIREDERVLAGPSPRALISLLRMSRAIAAMEGRNFVIPDDVKFVAPEVLG